MSSILAFDIETIPDVDGLRRLHDFPDEVKDAEVVEMAQRLLRQEKGHDFLPLPLQRVAVISCLLRTAKSEEPVKIFSLPTAEQGDDEAATINWFFRLIDKYKPTLVSWNGGGFDLPVLHYRAMRYGIVAATYWRADDEFRWNNYTNRFHERHLDLMDVLANYQARGWSGLDTFAKLCGLPGKADGMDGGSVWQAWQQGERDKIRRYCETDVLLTYLLYVRFQHFRGLLNGGEENAVVRAYLQQQGARWEEFLAHWSADGDRTASKKGGATTLL